MILKKRVFFFSILALLLLLFIVILKLNYYSIVFPVLFGILGSILFIIVDWFSDSALKRENEIGSEESTPKKIHSLLYLKIFTILFLIFYSFSLLSLFQGEYTKSVGYYLCISVCAGILILEILTYRTQIQGYRILLKTLLLSMNILFANHLIFIHGISLPDFGLHFNIFIMSILNTGHVSSSTIGLYNIFSLHHIVASEIAILTGYNPLSVYLLFGSLMIAIGILFVFIIGKRFVNFQFGLVAAVLFTCLDYYLMYGEHPEHQAYNYGFALICFTAILYAYRFQKPAFYVLFAFSAVAMILAHHLSAAIVFFTICSLVIIDILHIIQKRKLSIPSKYIAVTFSLLLFGALIFVSNDNPSQYVSSVIKPYFADMYSLIANLFVAPPPVISIPVTHAPVISIPVTPAPVISIPVTHAPVISIPVTPAPVISIPVTPAPVTPTPYVPPMGYDKLTLTTLFENTLGSSLLVLVSVLGFCSCIKKRSWFGDFTILNGILLSFLLGLGILFSYVFFLPDRLYPSLQIFSLVFLGTAGILWFHNAFPSRKRSIIVGCIFILVVMMSFFSLATIINGFETSPFVGDNLAYEKMYTTSQDVSFGDWRNSFIQNEKQNILPLSINDNGMIDIDTLPSNSNFFFDRTLQKTGILKSGNKFGQHTFRNINNEQLISLNRFSSYYDNGLIIMMNNNAE